MSSLEDLRKKVKEKEEREAEFLERKKLEEQLEQGTVRGIVKKLGKGLIKKILK